MAKHSGNTGRVMVVAALVVAGACYLSPELRMRVTGLASDSMGVVRTFRDFVVGIFSKS